MAQSYRRTKVFISYSHKDAKWLERLRVHLRPLEREHRIEIWDDTRIEPGTKWREEIEEALATSKVAVLLVSADFLASDFIATDELPRLLSAAEKEGAVILPLILSPSRFLRTTGIAQFQAVNDPSKPLISLTRGGQEAVLVKVSEAIEAALNRAAETVPEPPPFVKKSRRIDAAVPSHATVNEHIDLLVKVQFHDSPLLGIEDWPDRQKPASIKQTAAERSLEFPLDRRTSEVGSARLEIRLVAPDFEVRGTARKFVDVPPDRPSELVKFLITAKRSGRCKIDVEVYKDDKTYLGTIPLETNVDGMPAAEPPTVANLVLFVMVKREADELIKMTQDSRGKSVPNGRTKDTQPWYKRTVVIVALIGALGTLAGTIYKVGLPQITDGPSQNVAVRGRVSDTQGRALGGAKVSVEGKGLPPLIYTDSEGVFTVELPSDVKEVKIRVEAEGYDLYNRRVSLSAKNELEEIRLKRHEIEEKAELSGTVVDGNKRPLQGARVTLDDFPGMTPVETSSDGVFNLRDITKRYGQGVRVRVVMEGYLPNPYTEDVVLGAAPPIIELKRKR